MQFSKRKIAYKTLSFFGSLFSNRKIVAFYAPVRFHSYHLVPVIKKLIAESRVDIMLVGDFEKIYNTGQVMYYDSVGSLPNTKKINLFVATEFDIPWWLDCPMAYFGHGMGPKLNYASSENLSQYDYSFVTCKPTFEAQEKAKLSTKIIKTGLPIIDTVMTSREVVCEKLQLDPDKKILVYAPSWNAKIAYISPVLEIIKFLQKVKFANIVISPHPLLLQPNRCNGMVYFKDLPKDLIFNFPESGLSTLEVCAVSDAVISDISSVFFEAMSMNVAGIFDGNRELYNISGAEHLLPEIDIACNTLQLNDEGLVGIQSILHSNPKEKQQREFINNYTYNQGTATDVFTENIIRIVGANT